jgi:hypothetical protein
MIFEKGASVVFLYHGTEIRGVIVGIFEQEGRTGYHVSYRDGATKKILRMMAAELDYSVRAAREASAS